MDNGGRRRTITFLRRRTITIDHNSGHMVTRAMGDRFSFTGLSLRFPTFATKRRKDTRVVTSLRFRTKLIISSR